MSTTAVNARVLTMHLAGRQALASRQTMPTMYKTHRTKLKLKVNLNRNQNQTETETETQCTAGSETALPNGSATSNDNCHGATRNIMQSQKKESAFHHFGGKSQSGECMRRQVRPHFVRVRM